MGKFVGTESSSQVGRAEGGIIKRKSGRGREQCMLGEETWGVGHLASETEEGNGPTAGGACLAPALPARP